MKLIIEIPLDGNDLEATDLTELVREAKRAMGIEVKVGRPISEKQSHIERSFAIGVEIFTARIEE